MQYTPIRSYRIYDIACCGPITPMVALTAGLSAASTAASAAGTLAGGDAAMASAQRQQQQAEFKAMQEEQNAQQSRALGQRAALKKRRQGELAASNAQAKFAHSGGGAGDPSVLGAIGRLVGEAEYRALMDVYQGEAKADDALDRAALDRMAGEAALADGAAKQANSRFQAASTVLGGASSIFGKFK